MDDYKPNTDRFREEESKKTGGKAPEKKQVSQVTKSTARTKKKSKLASTFITEDVHSVTDYVLGDILIPTLKKTFSDMVSNGIDMMLFGETRGKRGRGDSRVNRVSYRDYSDNRDRRDRDRYDRRDFRRSSYDYDSIIVDNRGEAEQVLDSMDDIIDKYGHCSITDLYDLVGYDGGKYTDTKYGWTTMRGMEAIRTRDGGYEISTPPAKAL